MPDDANGNYTLPSGYLAVTGQTIQPSQHNPPLEDIAPALTARLSRSGVAPMTGPLKTVTGSASVPAISPSSNPAIGIYWTSTGIAFSGTVSGTRYIGELIPYTFLTPEPLTVLPYGQTLLRASYPDLWAKAQTDIAAGNTFYNNGDGSTTFGIGDMRGRVPAGKDNMGGTAASRLTGGGTGVNGAVLGAAGGLQTCQLVISDLPNLSLPVNIPAGQGSHSHGVSGGTLGGTLGRLVSLNDTSVLAGATAIVINAATLPAMSGTASLNGANQGHNNVQPTMVCNYLLYVGA